MSGAPLVVVTWPGFDPDAGAGAELLREAALDVRLEPKHGRRTPEEVSRIMAGASGAIVSTDPFDRAALVRLPELRVIARMGVGTDSIDLDAAAQHGIVVTTTPGANEQVVADHAIALILAVTRRIVEHDAAVRAGRWDRVGSALAGQLHGRTVGIIGLGAIGRSVAARLAGFGVTVLAYDPHVDDGETVSLDELLERSSIVSLHVPLDDSTRHLIGVRELDRLPRDAIVINTSRGGVVDEAALVSAIRSGHIGGAGIDVFEHEPPAGSPLLELPQVVLSPHIAALSHGSVDEMTTRACRSVVDVLAGRPTPDAIQGLVVGAAAGPSR